MTIANENGKNNVLRMLKTIKFPMWKLISETERWSFMKNSHENFM